MTDAITHAIFDAYGTLFDVTAAARRLAATDPALAEGWQPLAEDWRRKQLEYTWLRAIMGDHADFAQVTAEALSWALQARGLPDRLHAPLMSLYDRLDAFPEVPAMLAALRARGLTCAILSNGAPGMLAAAVASAGIGGHLAAVLSVEEVGVFKPDARVYALACDRLAIVPRQAVFVSSNGWDAAGAARFGFRSVWVNRSGAPVDRLPHRPAHMLPDLSQLPDLVRPR
jgi:2-haloacid dehalogenase